MKSIPRLKRWDKVLVKWIDSATHSRWTSIDKAKKLEACQCETVGMYLLHNKVSISIGLSVADKGDPEYECFDSAMTIPLCAVSKIIKLKE